MITALLGLVVLATVILHILSPGKTEPYLDEKGDILEGSISEKVFIDIGGVRQGMFIKGKNINNPVLLFLHGGMPEYFLAEKYRTGLEDIFTVVWWEQRGSGISYSSDIPPETMTSTQMMDDVVAVTNYLRHRFGREKIYLLAHSGGTFIGIQTAAQYPELFHAYIGVAQMSNQLNSEKLAYEYMLKRYKVAKDEKMVRKLESAPVIDRVPVDYIKIRDKAMHELGIGTTRDMPSIIHGIFVPSLTCKAYTVKEKLNMWRGKSRSGVAALWDDMLATNLMLKTRNLNVPVYFLSGFHDYTVSYPLAKEYFYRLHAPMKGFYTFENSAHSPMLEESEKAQRILKEDVLRGLNNLSD